MNIDILLLCFAGLCQFIVAWMGYHIAIHPPRAAVKKIWERGFLLVGLVGLVVIIWSGIRNLHLQDLLTQSQGKILDGVSQLHADVQHLNQTGKVSWNIPKERIQDIVAFLKSSPQPVKVGIVCNLGDSKGCLYAKQWLSVLQEAGWMRYDDGITQAVFSFPPQGITIQVQNKNTLGALQLQESFSAIGMTASGQLNPNFEKDTIQLIIGNLE